MSTTTLKTIFRLWLPLAISFELMMLEGPVIQGAIGRLPDAALNIAAFGLTMSLSLLVESPVIMLLATAIALTTDGAAYRALSRFTLQLIVGCTLLTGLIAFTPLFDLLTRQIMGQPAPIVNAARPAMQIMLLWTAAIAWRRFTQGVLVRNGQTRRVSWGTGVRLTFAATTALLLAHAGRLGGALLGACALMAAVLSEAVATGLFARPLVRDLLQTRPTPAVRGSRDASLPFGAPDAPLTQRAIWRFHLPLAATMLLTLLSQPLTAAALARLTAPQATLAAWPVAAMLLLVLRGPVYAIQEITVAQAGRSENGTIVLRSFAWIVGGVCSGAALLIGATPLLSLYLTHVLHLPLELHSLVRVGVVACVALPLLTALGAWARGLLVAGGATRFVYRGMIVNLAAHSAVLLLGIGLHGAGMWVAAGAFLTASGAELIYLLRQQKQLPASEPETSMYDLTVNRECTRQEEFTGEEAAPALALAQSD